MTAEDKYALQNQGVPADCRDELDIVKARFGLDKRYKIVAEKSGRIFQEVMECIRNILTTTKNDGGM